VDKIRIIVICSVILSALVLMALAADTADVNKPEDDKTPMQAEDVNEVQDETLDPDSPEAKLNKAWADAERANDSEAKGWLKLEMEQRVDFARAAQRTTEAQLDFIKMIAEAEGATQTVAAIDKIIEDRATKVDEVLDEAREERRQARIKELEEKRKAREELRQSRRERSNQQRRDEP
jgi:hypothetical protein